MARKPWYKALFERDYHDTFYRAGPVPRSVEEEVERAAGQVDFIAKCLEVPEGARVLDLCCGWGRLSIPLAQHGYRVTGLDLSKYHIRLAKKASKLAGIDIEWINADMREVPGRGQSRIGTSPELHAASWFSTGSGSWIARFPGSIQRSPPFLSPSDKLSKSNLPSLARPRVRPW